MIEPITQESAMFFEDHARLADGYGWDLFNWAIRRHLDRAHSTYRPEY